MALKAGRVGVAPSEVNSKGKIKTSSSDSYTKEESDSKFATKTDLSAKVDSSKIGGLEFRNNDGTAQYRLSSTDEWIDF